jgi:hypothetical protein
MSESNLWSYISSNIGHKGHFNRMESHATALGFPDVEYCIGGLCGQLELKYFEKGKKLPIVRPAQIGWFTQRVNAGGYPWILLKMQGFGNKPKANFFLIGPHDIQKIDPVLKVLVWKDSIEGLSMLTQIAKYNWVGSIDFDELLDKLRHPY